MLLLHPCAACCICAPACLLHPCASLPAGLQDDPSWVLDSVGRGKHAMLRELLRLAAAPASGTTPPPAAAAPVSAGELVGAARALLQQLLRLYSAAEAGGMYVGQQTARGAAATSAANDRFQLDAVLRQALSGGWMLPELRAPAALQRLLCALPPAHRVRLCALVVTEAIHSRSYEERGTAANAHMDALHAYWGEQGRGCSSFTAGDAVEVARCALRCVHAAQHGLKQQQRAAASFQGCAAAGC